MSRHHQASKSPPRTPAKFFTANPKSTHAHNKAPQKPYKAFWGAYRLFQQEQVRSTRSTLLLHLSRKGIVADLARDALGTLRPQGGHDEG